MPRPDCETIRALFPDLLAGPTDTSVAGPAREHMRSCGQCSAEFRGLVEILESAIGISEASVPDPPGSYWDQFLPSVRARLLEAGIPRLARPASPRLAWTGSGRAAVAAAALLMVAAGVSSFLMPVAPSRDRGMSVESLERSLDEKLAGLSPDQRVQVASLASDLIGTDIADEISPQQLLEALDEISPPADLGMPWVDDELREMLERLDRGQAKRLDAELRNSS